MANFLTFHRLATPGETEPLTFYPDLSGTSALAGTVGMGGLVSRQITNQLTFRPGWPDPLTFRYTTFAAAPTNNSSLDGTVLQGGLESKQVHPAALAGAVGMGGLVSRSLHFSALAGSVGIGGLVSRALHFSALIGTVQPGGLAAQWLHASALNGTVQLGGLQSGERHESALNGGVALGGLRGRKADGTSALNACVLPLADFSMRFDINVPAGPGATVQAARAAATPVLGRSALGWQIPPPVSPSNRLALAPGLAVANRLAASVFRLPRAGSAGGLALYAVPALGNGIRLVYWNAMARACAETRLALFRVAEMGANTALGLVHWPSVSHAQAYVWRATVDQISLWHGFPLAATKTLSHRIVFPLYRGLRLRMDRRTVIIVPPPPPLVGNFLTFVPGVWPVNWLVFNRSQPIRILPIRRVYTVLNTFALYRLSDHTHLPAQSLTLTDGQDAWAWTLNAGLAEMDAADLVAVTADGPVVVRAMVNRTEWDFIIEDPEGQETPEDTTSTIHGRSRTALFDEPYYPAVAFGNSADRLYSQVIADVTYWNGVSLGVDVTTTVDDWLLPALQWSFRGTPVAALKRLAEAPGARLASAKTGLGFAIDPYYPVLPWAWNDATPYATIPRGYWESHSRRRETKPRFDSVIIAGDTANGLIVPVQRDGSGGVWPAPQIIDRLMTSTTPARQRGAGILADTGRQAMETISLPIGTEFGLIPKGALLELQDKVTWRGLVRSVSVSVALVGEGGMDVMQTLNVERHYD